MSSLLTTAANAAASNTQRTFMNGEAACESICDPHKPSETEVDAYLTSIAGALLSIPSVETCQDGNSSSMMNDVLGTRSFVWETRKNLDVVGGRIAALHMATGLEAVSREGHVVSLELIFPTTPTSPLGVQIRTAFSRCATSEYGRIRCLPHDNDEPRYMPAHGTWSERAEVVKEFARLVSEHGALPVSEVLLREGHIEHPFTGAHQPSGREFS